MKSRGKRPVRKRPAPESKKVITSGAPPAVKGPVASSGIQAQAGAYDPVLIVVFALLVCIGVVMVFSSSGVFSYVKLQDSSYYLKQQIKFLAIGGVFLLITLLVDYRYYIKMAGPALLGTLFLLCLVPFIGVELNGAKRWLSIGGTTIQVSEFAKTAMVVYMAVFLAACGKRIQEPGVFALAMGKFAVLALLLLAQPDFGMTGLIGCIVIGMLFVAGARISHIACIIGAGVAACIPIIMMKPYRLARIIGYLDPEADPLGAGWQKIQAMIAIANGGIFGRGLGDSIQKRLFLPQQHTDFIYSIIGEEFGLMGMVFVSFLFILLIHRGLAIARTCNDLLGKYLTIGIVWMLTLQAGLNMGVAVGMLPVTGLTLPCISSGGASLVCTFICFGILLNISAHTSRRSRRPNENDNPGSRRDRGTHISGNGAGGVLTATTGRTTTRRRKARRPGAADLGKPRA